MAYSPTYDATGIEYHEIQNFSFRSGDILDKISVAYRSFNPASTSGAMFIPTCYGGLINNTLNFTSGALAKNHVIVAAMLGNGESSSPSNCKGFPKKLDYIDVVKAHHDLLTKKLGIKGLEAVIGFSMGGQQAYYWACMYPQFMKVAVPICGSARTSGHNYAFLEGPKAALLNSVDYADGQYKEQGQKPSRGLRAFGRAYCAWAMSAAWWRQRLWEKSGATSMEEFIVKMWETAFEGWDAEDVLILARMWQAGDVGALREDGDYTKALEGIRARVLVMPARTDQYFPPEDSEIEMKYLKYGELAVLETVWGHVGGGGANEEDTLWMDKKISNFLK